MRAERRRVLRGRGVGKTQIVGLDLGPRLSVADENRSYLVVRAEAHTTWGGIGQSRIHVPTLYHVCKIVEKPQDDEWVCDYLFAISTRGVMQ